MQIQILHLLVWPVLAVIVAILRFSSVTSRDFTTKGAGAAISLDASNFT